MPCVTESPFANLLQGKTHYIESTRSTHSSQTMTKTAPTPSLTVNKIPAQSLPCAPCSDRLGKVPLLPPLITTDHVDLAVYLLVVGFN